MGRSFEDMTVAELKDRLYAKGLPVSGRKSELIDRLRGKQSVKQHSNVPDNVVDKTLYTKIRNDVKKRVKVWPSAYASGQVVREYKAAGGRYRGKKSGSDLDRWYKEKWVNVCKPQGRGYAPCGRSESKVSRYPYCRPSVRVNSSTPMTVGELKKKYGPEKLKQLCKKKRTTALPKDGKARRIRPRETKRR